nr:unnamed protein product [Digitaria exilis]
MEREDRREAAYPRQLCLSPNPR